MVVSVQCYSCGGDAWVRFPPEGLVTGFGIMRKLTLGEFIPLAAYKFGIVKPPDEEQPPRCHLALIIDKQSEVRPGTIKYWIYRGVDLRKVLSQRPHLYRHIDVCLVSYPYSNRSLERISLSKKFRKIALGFFTLNYPCTVSDTNSIFHSLYVGCGIHIKEYTSHKMMEMEIRMQELGLV